MAKIADTYFAVDPWKITENGFDPAYARVSESVFSLGNESIGVRGYFDEGGSTDSLRGAYINGVYDIVPIGRSYRGIVDKTHFMVPACDFLMCRLSVDGETLDLGRSAFREFRRELDMRRGTLTRSFIWETRSGKSLRLTFLRFTDMQHRERVYQRITAEALNFSGELSFSSGLSFRTVHEGQGKCFWQPARCTCKHNTVALQARTLVSGLEVFSGAALFVPAELRYTEEESAAAFSADIRLVPGCPVHADKHIVLVFDGSKGEALHSAGNKALEEAAVSSFEDALRTQEEYWAAYWRTSDIVLTPAPDTEEVSVLAEQQGIRFCSFQLAQTYTGGSARHNIGAKGLTGEAYNGHAFWDTESCCLPFYLFTNPDAARDLLLFRYHTLPEARNRARMLDCRGACYPIATLNGDEACPLWQHASLQLQPSTAVAYGIWHYVHVTGDTDFLYAYGAEMLLEIARFLASRVAQSPLNGKYGFYGVMGPDEFHMMVNNNAYTNYMGMRTLSCTLDTLHKMREAAPGEYAALVQKTGLTAEETEHWAEIAANMYLPVTGNGLIEQHDGFFGLPHTDIDSIPVSEFPLYEHWSYDRIYRTDMIKQPDVLMMLYLYNSSFSEEVKRVNYEYYLPRTIHESSLSPAIHSILAAELDKREDAVNFFGFATRLDLDNYNRNTREGLHITSIAMAWANIVYGFAGLRSDGEMLSFAPRLPERWSSLQFSLVYRGRIIRIRMEIGSTRFELVQGEPLPLCIYREEQRLGAAGLTVPAR